MDSQQRKVQDALRNPFIPIDVKYVDMMQELRESKKTKQEITVKTLRQILTKQKPLQIQTLALIHQQSRRNVQDLLPNLQQALFTSTEDQLTFSLMSMLTIYFRDTDEQHQSKNRFINTVLNKLGNSSEIICLLFFEIIQEKSLNIEQLYFGREIEDYINFSWSKSIQLDFIKFALDYTVKADRPVLICQWFDTLMDFAFKAPDSFIQCLLELLIYFKNQLSLDVYKRMKNFEALKDIRSLSLKSNQLALQLMSLMAKKVDEALVIQFLQGLDKNVSLLENPQNLSLVIPIVQYLVQLSKSNCIAIFSCKNLLHIIFTAFTSNKTNMEQCVIEICINLLKPILSPQLIAFYQEQKVIPKIYSIIIEFLSQYFGREYYVARALQVGSQIMVYQNYWQFDEQRAVLFISIQKLLAETPEHQLSQFDLSLVTVIQATIERCMLRTKIKYRMQQIDSHSYNDWMLVFGQQAVYPFCDRIISQIFERRSNFTVILFKNPLGKKVLAEAYREAALAWRSSLSFSEAKNKVIFTDIHTEAEHYVGLAQFLKIDLNKSPIVLIDGAKRTKYVLTKAPPDITSADIVAFVGSVEKGSTKEYKIDEKVE